MNTTCWIWISAHMVQDRAAAALRMILFFGVAMVAVPLILGLALDAGASWRWILIAEAGLELVSGLAVVCSYPSWTYAGARTSASRSSGRCSALDPKLLLGMMIAGFIYMGAEMTMNIWLPKFQIDVFGGGDAWPVFAVTLFWVGLMAGRLLVTALTRRFSPARLLLVCACTIAVFAVAVAFAPSQAISGAGGGRRAGSVGLVRTHRQLRGALPGMAVGGGVVVVHPLRRSGQHRLPLHHGAARHAAGFRVGLAVLAVPALVYGAASLLIHASSRPATEAPDSGS